MWPHPDIQLKNFLSDPPARVLTLVERWLQWQKKKSLMLPWSLSFGPAQLWLAVVHLTAFPPRRRRRMRRVSARGDGGSASRLDRSLEVPHPRVAAAALLQQHASVKNKTKTTKPEQVLLAGRRDCLTWSTRSTSALEMSPSSWASRACTVLLFTL